MARLLMVVVVAAAAATGAAAQLARLEQHAPPQPLGPPASSPPTPTVTLHNSSNCCCQNIYPRSAANLVSTVDECVSNCRVSPLTTRPTAAVRTSTLRLDLYVLRLARLARLVPACWCTATQLPPAILHTCAHDNTIQWGSAMHSDTLVLHTDLARPTSGATQPSSSQRVWQASVVSRAHRQARHAVFTSRTSTGSATPQACCRLPSLPFFFLSF